MRENLRCPRCGDQLYYSGGGKYFCRCFSCKRSFDCWCFDCPNLGYCDSEPESCGFYKNLHGNTMKNIIF